jgi:signal peptidase
MENQKKAFQILIDVIVWAFVLIAAIITISVFSSQSNGGVANFFGYIPATIQTDSMYPTLKKGDLIIDKKISDSKSLKKGDIITFWTIIQEKRVKNTHKIESIQADGSFITRGDANDKADEKIVYKADLIGVYTGTKLVGIGKIADFLQSPTGFLFFIVLPLLLFFLYQVYKFVVIIISIKKPKLSQDEEEELKKKAVEEYLKNQEQAKEIEVEQEEVKGE